MSLINEALKKAQRSRGDGQAGETGAPFGNAGPVAKRGKARSSQTIVLIASGAIVLVVLTVVGTFWFANRPAAQPEHVVAKKPAQKTVTPGDTPPIVVPPVNAPPTTLTPATSTNPGPSPEEKSLKAGETKKGESATTTAETKSGAAPVVPAPTPTPTTPTTAPSTLPVPGTATASTPPAPVSPTSNPPPSTSPAGSGNAPNGSGAVVTAATPPAATPGAPAGAPKPDERIAAYVDGLRITAIRANDAKIIMNEKVYRVNDVVERSLGVRLVKVAPDSLTFADANGVTYVKYF